MAQIFCSTEHLLAVQQKFSTGHQVAEKILPTQRLLEGVNIYQMSSSRKIALLDVQQNFYWMSSRTFTRHPVDQMFQPSSIVVPGYCMKFIQNDDNLVLIAADGNYKITLLEFNVEFLKIKTTSQFLEMECNGRYLNIVCSFDSILLTNELDMHDIV